MTFLVTEAEGEAGHCQLSAEPSGEIDRGGGRMRCHIVCNWSTVKACRILPFYSRVCTSANESGHE